MKQAAMPWHVAERPQNWRTPPWLFLLAEERYAGARGYSLDVAADALNARCRFYFDEEHDALSRPWIIGEDTPRLASAPDDARLYGDRDICVWCNPEYDDIGAWIRRGVEELDRGSIRLVTFLVPARTDRSWWHDYVTPRAWCIDFIDGRVPFDPPPGTKASTPFEASVLITFQHRIVARERRAA